MKDGKRETNGEDIAAEIQFMREMDGISTDVRSLEEFEKDCTDHIRFLRNKWYDVNGEADKLLFTIALAGIGLQLTLVKAFGTAVPWILWVHFVSILCFAGTSLWYYRILKFNQRLFALEQVGTKSELAWAKANNAIPASHVVQSGWDEHDIWDKKSSRIDAIYWTCFVAGLVLFIGAIGASFYLQQTQGEQLMSSKKVEMRPEVRPNRMAIMPDPSGQNSAGGGRTVSPIKGPTSKPSTSEAQPSTSDGSGKK